ncbi:hypothetical protein LINGRAHAP2_LOCUS30050 [Linum grandiflorum]
MEAMDGKTPKNFITGVGKAMKNTIVDVFLETNLRLCL